MRCVSKYFLFVVALPLLSLISPLEGADGGPHYYARGRVLFNPENLTSVSGTVKDVVLVERYGRFGGYGVHLILESGDKSYDVHLGPAWYLERAGLLVKEGNEVTVKGYLIEGSQQNDFIATDVDMDGKTFNLRDDNGLPFWRGGPRRVYFR